jgi:hypothetical protein
VLDLDVFSVGETLDEAIEMVQDAAAMTLEHDLENGLDPARRRAPKEYWEKLSALLGEHRPKRLSSIIQDEGTLTRVATQIVLRFEMIDKTATQAPGDESRLAWPAELCA